MDEPTPIHVSRVADELKLTREQVAAVISLMDAENTVPFITRYRKEQTGNLDEEQIRQIQQRVTLLRQLAERAGTILRLIETQGKLTPELRAEIEQADSLKRLEDLYLPYRPKRKSRAMLARQRGLEPLANRVWDRDPALANLEAAAGEFINPEHELTTAAEVLQGVADILAERISEVAKVREKTRQIARKSGTLAVTATKSAVESGQEYRDYFDYREAVAKIPPHRAMALNRGEKASVLRVKFSWDDEQANAVVTSHFELETHPFAEFMKSCATDALQRLIQPSLERELRRELTERAESHAVSVFARNLKNLLLQPPLQGRRVVAIDPGFRTGCKVAVLDEYGQCLTTDVIYVTGSADKRSVATKKLAELAQRHNCLLFAIGNGTACRETVELVSEIIAELLPEARYLVVNEAGASIYSTSTVAREEFPDVDATVRGTISIGRRLQDPLSELVKLDPQHIGVGMYQHDVSPKLLKESLDQVIESCVNFVGVDLNTASSSLLRHVSGLNQLIARRVVEWREENVRFRNRQQLLEVAGIGEATFTQAAGFLKISGGGEPLDSTWIHPESYAVSRKVLERLQTSPEQLIGSDGASAELRNQLTELEPDALAAEVEVGLPTLKDILDALVRPGRDPRDDQPGPVFKQGVLKLDDLQPEMELTGTVLNVVDFGVFVDIGLKDSGLVHVSQLSTQFIRSPHDLVSVGDVVTVWVMSVDQDRRRVSLTMVKPGTPRHAKPAKKPSGQKPKPVPATSAAVTNRPQRKQQSDSDQNTAKVRTRKPKPPRKQKPADPPPELTTDMVEGREPLRGFDELKELWRNRSE